MRRLNLILSILIVFSLFAVTVFAAPGQQVYGKVAIVAQSGGGYTDPLTAMNNLSSWCGTPSASNPCLIKIMPGVYNIGASSLQLQPYVDVEGAGENVTIITGNISTELTGVIAAASNSEIRLLTIENTSSSYAATCLSARNASPKLSNLSVKTAAGTLYATYGIYTENSNAIISNLTVTSALLGVYLKNGSPKLDNVNISNTDMAIINDGAASRMNNLSITASNQGIRCFESEAPVVTNSTILVADQGIYIGTYGGVTLKNVIISAANIGVHNSSDRAGTVKINHSEITSPGQTMLVEYGSVSVGDTKLSGGPAFINYGASATCKYVGVYDGNYDLIPCPLQ